MSEKPLNYYCSGTCDNLQTILYLASTQFNIPGLREHPQRKKKTETAKAAIFQPVLKKGKMWLVMDVASKFILFFSFFTAL